jgi:hypothetical protein
MTKINSDDMLKVFVAQPREAREEALERLIQAAYQRGFEDAQRLAGLTLFEQMRAEHRREEAALGIA